jgi:uncharacterized protein
MITEDQTAVIDFLAAPSTHGGAPVERIDTHSAVVFLSGDGAWKLKRAVHFDYLDFSTAERRRALCEEEVRLNRRTAPTLYRGVAAVTRERDGSLALGGAGTPVDWVVEMNRFDEERVFDRLAATGQLDPALMRPLAHAVARFHQAAERRDDRGGKSDMSWVIEGNATSFAQEGADILDPSACQRLTDGAREELERRSSLLEMRRAEGFVRQCHGDLHLRNIVLLDGVPTLFDAVEFNDRIACVDVLYDLAFLVMDLWRRQLPRHANAVWNGYLTETGDLEGLALMALFLSCRAAVRAKTGATAARVQTDARRARELRQLAREYLAMAERLLRPARPGLVAIGGLSGSGKSTLALALAPALGAVPGSLVIRSDELRKRLAGVPVSERLGPEGYTPEMSSRVYAAMAQSARQALAGGYHVIVDAVHTRAVDRAAIERVAEAAAVPFMGLWLDAPEPTLVERTDQRRHDASDADANVIRVQHAQSTGEIHWHRIDASRASESVVRTAQGLLAQQRS